MSELTPTELTPAQELVRKIQFSPVGQEGRSGKDPKVEIFVVERLTSKDGCGSQAVLVWPAARVLSHYIYSIRDVIRGKSVVELGAGAGIPGVLCAKLGAKSVLLTDTEDVISACERSIFANDIKEFCSADVLRWGRYPSMLLKLGPQDFVLASDCLYNSEDFEDVIATLDFFLQVNPLCTCLVTYHERSSSRSIHHLLEKWLICCNEVTDLRFLPEEVQESESLASVKLFALRRK
jgi:hypothetical protein